jgi:hypothetical protein
MENQSMSVYQLGNSAVSGGGNPRVLWVSESAPQLELPALGFGASLERMSTRQLRDSLDSVSESADVAAVLVADVDAGTALSICRELRARKSLDRTRLFVSIAEPFSSDADLDIEDVQQVEVTGQALASQLLTNGVAAHRALGNNPLLTRNYLDASYNEIYDWFELTRWDWKDIDLSSIQRDLLSENEIAILKESAIIEFGTLPGAHNFLREWADEYSFSSWVLSWGAEEARHSLVQSRYLRAIGIEVEAKHAMYKRDPYPVGDNRAATLMMNIVSEARAAEYYMDLSRLTKEPVLREIWKLLGRDESRHCKAFAFFCKELCDHDRANIPAALEMAYVFCADRANGVKHPAGYFYQHSTSTKGLRATEAFINQQVGVSTDRADRRVLDVIRQLTGDESIRAIADVRRKLREFN